ncbi:MAG: DNA repair and recombination protein RadB [Candidatus Aenigmatarchaeota archaeon]|nr:DNA repair and recombination protein RadB [Nanoarchaeota archaeon]
MDLILPEPFHSLIGQMEARTITNFYGGPGTGKTCACIIAMTDCLRKGGKVIFVDTESGLSEKRVKQIYPEFAGNNIELLEPSDFTEQGNVIRGLQNKEADLIIVDSLVSLYRLEYADPKIETIEANRELSKQMSVLARIAKEKNIPVLVTAHTFKNWDTGEDEVVGGSLLKYWSKTILFFERTGRTSERKVTIAKHRHLAEGKHAKFDLIQTGIQPAGFKLF